MKNRQKRSPIWKIDKEELINIIDSKNNFSEILECFSLNNKGGNVRTLKTRLDYDNINYDHLKNGSRINRRTDFLRAKIPLADVLVKNSNYSRGSLKKRLIEDGLLKNECQLCHQQSEWQNKKLIMILDHINGIYNDNRLENLRLLCPNCNSQTKTFAGRRLKKNYYCKCGMEIYKDSTLCNKCSSVNNGFNRRKINRPSKEQLLKELENSTYVALGKKYGVSDSAIKKWLK